MKYRDPRTGTVYENINDAVQAFCKDRTCCDECPFNDPSDVQLCLKWSETHPDEAAQMMGLEVLRYGL